MRTYREFERVWIGELAAVVPLAYREYAFWQRPWVSGLWLNPVQMATFADAIVRRPEGPVNPQK